MQIFLPTILFEHAWAVQSALNDLDEARQRVSQIVSRDTQSLEAQGVTRATIESVMATINRLKQASSWYSPSWQPVHCNDSAHYHGQIKNRRADLVWEPANRRQQTILDAQLH
jgi:hypothetical protein